MEMPPEQRQVSKTEQRVFRWSKRRELLMRTLIATAIVVLAALIGIWVVTSRSASDSVELVPAETQNEQAQLAAEDLVRLTVDGESYDVNVDTSLTVEQLMDQALELRPNDGSGDVFTYTKQISGVFGVFVTRVGSAEQRADESLFWTYKVNGVNASLGISEQRVVPGDIIAWQLAGPDAF